MANEQNLKVPTSKEAREYGRLGGIASGKARQERATMKKVLEDMLKETNNTGLTYQQLATLGLIKGAIDGKAENYKVIVSLLGELEENNETPQVNINIVDNSDLEKVLYEDENE